MRQCKQECKWNSCRQSPRPNLALSLAGVLILLTMSCSADSPFTKAYGAVDRSHGRDNLLAQLVRLDQDYPDRFVLKHEIGMLYLQGGDPNSAAPYLERALALAGRGARPSDKATLYGGLAIVSYSRGDYPKAAELGQEAVKVKANEAAPFGFITGRALLAQDKQKEALEYLDAAWKAAKPFMSAEDYRAYARALESAGRNRDLITVLDSYEAAYPYEPGLGLMQSAAYERLGDLDSSVLAAFKEAEYATAYGASRPADIQNNLAAIGKKLDDKAFNPSGSGTSALEAVSAFARGDWAAAERLFARRGGTGTFEKYLFLSARIEGGRENAGDVNALAALQPSMRSLPPYYFRLYLGLRAVGDQSPDRLADVLESAIDLAPRTDAASAYRKELAVVLGLTPSDGPHLLTKTELSAAADNSAATGESSLLEPLVGTLELKDNRSTLMAVGILRAFAQDARHRPFFMDRVRAAKGRTRERLEYILAH
jgi:tetratricopeptide (TPR) repeat protein